MRTNLQITCLVTGVLLLVFIFAFNSEVGYTSSVGLRITYWSTFAIVRLGAIVLAGYVANDIRRGMFLFIFLTLVLPGPSLIVLGLLKPKKIEDNEKQMV